MERVIFVLLLGVGLAAPLSAGTRGPSEFTPIISTVVQDTNRWEIWQDNRGRFVVPQPGSNPGGFWPKYSGHNYLFGAGIWVGVVDTLRTRGDTAVSWGYNPNSGQAEFCPTTPDGNHNRYLDSLARVYRSDIPQDTAQWPERDSLGRMIVASDQELWAIANDFGPYMIAQDSAIGVQVIRRSYAWNSPGPWGDIVKMEFEVKNVTGRWGNNPHTLPEVILSLCVDADIGNESGTAANDRLYLDRTPGNPFPNVAVQYQLAQEPGWGPPPYFLGMKFVEGPKNNTGDTLRIRSRDTIGYPQYDRDVLPGQPLGLTAFQIFDITYDPSTPGERYLELSGRDYRTPQIYNAYQKDTFAPGDKRFLLSCGPFDLPNDSTVKLVAHIIGGSDSLDIIRKAELLGVESPPGPVARNASGVVLYPSFPNPARGSCLIRYALPERSSVSLKVYDISGRLVRELERGERPAGFHSVSWDGRDAVGNLVASGVYLYRLKVPGSSLVGKALLLR